MKDYANSHCHEIEANQANRNLSFDLSDVGLLMRRHSSLKIILCTK